MAAGFILPFIRKEQIAQHTYAFFFKREAQQLQFQPGQYIRMTLPSAQPDDRGTSRYFTIASSPTEKEYALHATQEGPSTFKKTLFALQEGQEVQFFGPLGTFVFDPSDTRHHIFLAGGIGITPYRSMVQYAYDRKLTIPITLFVSWKTPEDMVFDTLLQAIKEKSNWLTYVPTMTRMEESQAVWNGEKGRISQELISTYAPDFLKAVFFITGPPVMVEAMEQIVKDMGVPEEQIKIEKFTGY